MKKRRISEEQSGLLDCERFVSAVGNNRAMTIQQEAVVILRLEWLTMGSRSMGFNRALSEVRSSVERSTIGFMHNRVNMSIKRREHQTSTHKHIHTDASKHQTGAVRRHRSKESSSGVSK